MLDQVLMILIERSADSLDQSEPSDADFLLRPKSLEKDQPKISISHSFIFYQPSSFVPDALEPYRMMRACYRGSSLIQSQLKISHIIPEAAALSSLQLCGNAPLLGRQYVTASPSPIDVAAPFPPPEFGTIRERLAHWQGASTGHRRSRRSYASTRRRTPRASSSTRSTPMPTSASPRSAGSPSTGTSSASPAQTCGERSLRRDTWWK